MASGSNARIFGAMDGGRLEEILSGIGGVRVALIGDLCLDAYWKADMTKSELSRETPHFPLPVVEERYSPGAGGNAAANIAALEPLSVRAVGAIGRDWRGDVLMGELKRRGIDVSGVLRHPLRVTNAYIKPCRRGISDVEYEDPRLDFANAAPQSAELDEAVAAELVKAAGSADVLCVCDQLQMGCVTDAVRACVVRLAGEGLRVVADSRSRIGLFTGCILKPNEAEGIAATGMRARRDAPGIEGCVSAAEELAKRAGSPVCMTLGEKGCVAVGDGRTCHVPGIVLPPPLDICGAGDTFLAAFACALAAGASLPEAAYVGNLASSVTVKKLGQTGTAGREEILLRHGGLRQ